MTTQSNTFTPRRAGITAFMDHNKIDFVFQGPNTGRDRFSTRDGLAGTLNGRPFEVIDILYKDEAQPDEPTHIKVKYGALTLNLGRRWKASGDPSFFQSVGRSNPVVASEVGKKLKAMIAANRSES